MRKLAAKTEGPLAGLVVVDLTRVLAGPYCTLILADLGARVIKVEAPGCGDDSRDAGPFIPSGDEHPPTSAYFFSVNRNKESIALDLKDRADREVLDALIADADILVENFRPGVLERLGLQWETLHARHPGLILASISGFGQTGPYSREVAYDIIVQAMGGVMSLTGSEAGEPTRVGISIGDLAAGMFGALGVMAAVIERNRTGLGKYVDVAMLDSQIALLENALARYQVDGKAPSAIGSRHPSITPFAPYRVRDGRIVIAAGNEAMFRRLSEVLAMPQLLTDPRFATNGARTEHHAELAEAMEARLCERTGAEWVQRLRSAGVACGPVNDVAALMSDPHVAAREMLAELPVPGGMKLKVANSPIKFFGEPVARSSPAPRLDEHRRQLLREIGMPPRRSAAPSIIERQRDDPDSEETAMIQRLTRLADAVSGAAFVLTCLMLAVLAVSILYEVFSRYVIGSPTIWVSEVGSYLVVGIALLGSAWTQRANCHFKMDALEHYFPSLAPAAHVFTCAAIGCFAAFLAWTGIEMTWASYSFGWRTPSLLATPLWIPQSAIPLGAAALLIQALADCLKGVAGLRPARGA